MNERTKSVANRVLQDLGLGINGRNLTKAQANLPEMIERLSTAVNTFLKIEKASRDEVSAEQAQLAFDNLDRLGDDIKKNIKWN